MRKKFLVFGEPLIEQEEINEFIDSVSNSWIGKGKKVSEFEKNFAAYKKVKYSAALSSCSAALHLACLSAGIRPGDEIITSAMTFCSAVHAIIHAGATPVLADINPVTLNISPVEIQKKITPKTRAIMVVHFAGRPCDMDAIMSIARKHNLFVIEDCAHAIESEYKGMPCGTIGNIGCFSFYANKNITTGEGGMAISNEEAIILSLKRKAMHGMTQDAWERFSDEGFKHYFVVESGFKYNMTDLQAAFGIHQLKRIEKYWHRRKELWNRYMQSLRNLPLGLPAEEEQNTRHACHLFTLRINPDKCGITRDEFIEKMHWQNIGCGVHYHAIPQHPYFRSVWNFKEEDFPHAVRYGNETVSIPLSPKLTDEDAEDVISAIHNIFR